MQSAPQETLRGLSGLSARLRPRLKAPLYSRVRLVAVCALGVFGLQWLCGAWHASGYVPLSEALEPHGLEVSPSQAASLGVQRRGADPQPVVFRAHGAREPGDVWLAQAVLSPDGRVTDLERLRNVTRTSSADEGTPLAMGRHVMFARSIAGEVVGLEVLDLAGEARPQLGMVSLARRAITNFQQTGSWSGVGRRSYVLRTKARHIAMRSGGGRFIVELDGERVVIDPAIERPREGADRFDVRTHRAAVAAPLPWLVDTVRALSWVGPDRIAWLENRVFAVRDWAKQLYHRVRPVDDEAEVAAELGLAPTSHAAEEEVERLAVPNPESGWPPAAVEPLATPEVAGEGKWRAIVSDPHVRELPSGAPVFYQTFLRPDTQRTFARVYLTLWDPRLVQLHVVSGTEEPVSATGETGSGLIPRDPATLERLVAAFNGGFQAVHGEFGMMADKRVYLPPKPWAATVAVFEGGRVGMGSWPGPEDRKAGYDEATAVASLPADLVSFRQNLTSLVEDGRFNPWGRWWWGAAPQRKSEQTFTQRSALCMTREGLMLYAWGDSLSPEALGQALVAARCVRAMHLDMNSGHSGMEFYKISKAEDAPGGATRGHESFRFEGTVPGLPGHRVRARKAVTSMGLQLPRYIKPDPRDYFYLTLKAGIETVAPRGGPLSSADLPHAGWPPALARQISEGARVVRLDPARAVPRTSPPTDAEVLLAELRGKERPAALDDFALYVVKGGVAPIYAVGVPPPGAESLLKGPLLGAASKAESALGVDADGLLLYAELRAPKPGDLAALMAARGVAKAIELDRVWMGLKYREGLLRVDGASRLRDGGTGLWFVASSSPAVEVLFPDNRPMPYSQWAQLQDRRVRYFRTSEPTTRAPPGALSPRK